jgi:pilus assembly protein CpaE
MRAVVASAQADRGTEVRRILLSEGLTCEGEDVIGYEGLPGCLAAEQPDLVLVCCDAGQPAALAAIQTAYQLFQGPILAVGEADIALVREAMQAGAGEFLDVRNLRRDLAAALVHIESAPGGASQRGKIITVFSPAGGAGVSTVAINLAVLLARLRPQREAAAAGASAARRQPDAARGAAEPVPASLGPHNVALLDLTPAPSDLSLLLDLEPKHTLAEVSRRRDHLDRKMLAGAMTAYAAGLYVLPQAGYPQQPEALGGEPDGELVRQLFVLLRRTFALVVVDLGHAIAEAQVEAMRLSNLVLLVCGADVPGVRRVGWALDCLKAQGVPQDRFQLVLGRYGEPHHVKRAQIEETLGMTALGVLPENAALATRARNEGVPLVELSAAAKIGTAFSALAREVQQLVAGATE